jgi:hypothetical protein
MANLESNIALIDSLFTSATSSLSQLKKPSSSTSSSSTDSTPPPPLQDIRNDVQQLLQLLSKEITALSLALKPPTAHDALKQTLDKVVGLEAKLKFAGEQLPVGGDGVLAKRIKCVFVPSSRFGGKRRDCLNRREAEQRRSRSVAQDRSARVTMVSPAARRRRTFSSSASRRREAFRGRSTVVLPSVSVVELVVEGAEDVCSECSVGGGRREPSTMDERMGVFPEREKEKRRRSDERDDLY